jgi:hypothetical protein
VNEIKNPLEWIYDGMIAYTPSTGGSFLCEQDIDYQPADNDISLSEKEHGRREFKQWLATTDYNGRCRSTKNYCSLNRYDQITFRSQMKAIFHHVLYQFVGNDADTVWDDLVYDETKKPNTTRNG